jgi:hypothetical protein
MDTAFPARTNHVRTHHWTPRLIAATAAIVIFLVGAALVLFAQQTLAPVAQSNGGLSPLQIVIRGEVADRLEQSASAGLSPLQIVIRGEVADRLEQSASKGR